MSNIGLLINKGNIFYKHVSEIENSRFKSWEHCYKSFYDAHKNKKNDKVTIDYLSLQLSFYLASWGMYRGSSFLLSLDYKVHEKAVSIILDKKYDSLWNIDILNYNDDMLDLLEDLISDIKDYYSGLRKCVINDTNKYYKLDKPIPKNDISDTLVSKILLGTIGCVPAYDRFFIKGLKYMNIAPTTLGKKSLKRIIEFYKDNYDTFEKERKKINIGDIEYPQMKLIDSCFWQLGYEIYN